MPQSQILVVFYVHPVLRRRRFEPGGAIFLRKAKAIWSRCEHFFLKSQRRFQARPVLEGGKDRFAKRPCENCSVFKKGEGGPEAPGALRLRNKKATASVASSYSQNPPVGSSFLNESEAESARTVLASYKLVRARRVPTSWGKLGGGLMKRGRRPWPTGASSSMVATEEASSSE